MRKEWMPAGLSLWQRLQTTEKPIVLYGMGNGADKIMDALEERNICATGFFASDEFVRGQNFRGFAVTSYAEAKERWPDMIVLVAFGTHREDVIENIMRISREQELYAPDVDVIGKYVFDTSFFEQYREELNETYEMLADDLSRRTFAGILNYKASGKVRYLFGCEIKPEEVYREILEPGESEVFVDAGAYVGDTLEEFLRYAGGWGRAIALEPDVKNFNKLVRNTGELKDLERICAAADSEDGQKRFAVLGGRQSVLSDAGGITAETVRIDTVAPDATMIKLDVEGNEYRALQGAEGVIRNNAPKLSVAAYHKSEDVFRLPLLVKSMYKDYKLYMRHMRSVPGWDTNFYFV